MPRLTWGTSGTRLYETGIDRGVLYLDGEAGVPWVGLSSVEENPTGGSTKSYYLDGEKYLQVSSREEFAATLNALTYPDEFARCDGTAQIRKGLFLTQQRRKQFGFSYRTLIGNDLSPDHGYKIHIVYNALAEPSQRTYSTLNESIDPTDFSWSIVTKPPAIAGFRRTSHVVIDTRKTDPRILADVENALYGNDETMSRLPSLDELIVMFEAYNLFVVTSLGDGLYQIDGPDEAIQLLGEGLVELDWETVIANEDSTYSVSSG